MELDPFSAATSLTIHVKMGPAKVSSESFTTHPLVTNYRSLVQYMFCKSIANMHYSGVGTNFRFGGEGGQGALEDRRK